MCSRSVHIESRHFVTDFNPMRIRTDGSKIISRLEEITTKKNIEIINF